MEERLESPASVAESTVATSPPGRARRGLSAIALAALLASTTACNHAAVARAATLAALVRAPPSPFVSGCEDYARAVCGKGSECAPAPLRLTFGTVPMCVERVALGCTFEPYREQATWSSSRCVEAIGHLDCDGLFAGTSLAACLNAPVASNHVHHGCSFDDQCASGRCAPGPPRGPSSAESDEPFVCEGSCVEPALAAPGACSAAIGMDSPASVLGLVTNPFHCPRGTVCDPKTERCVEGRAPCEFAARAREYPLLERACGPNGDAGAACGGDDDCDAEKLLVCRDWHCAEPRFARTFEACGDDQAPIVRVLGGPSLGREPLCDMNGICDPATHRCLPALAPGGALPAERVFGPPKDPRVPRGCMPPAGFTLEGVCAAQRKRDCIR